MDDVELIAQLLSKAEGPELDFKSTHLRIDEPYHKAHFVKDLVSMANTRRENSAVIIFGIKLNPNGTKESIGVTEHPDDANLQELIASRVHPIPRFQYRPVTFSGTNLGILEIYPQKGGPFIPQFDFQQIVVKGMPYFRRGSSNAIPSSQELREIIKWMDEDENKKHFGFTGLTYLNVGGGVFDYPCYFPSISSLRTQYKPINYLRILIKSNYPWFLISAYDIARTAGDEKTVIRELLRNAMLDKKVLLDSGYYESSSKNDIEWNEKDYWEVIKTFDFSFAFSFDNRENIEEKSTGDLVKEVIENWKRDVDETGKANIIPIVHGYSPEDFTVIVPEVVQAINPVMIAMPERELGEGIIKTARTIFNIRKNLHEIGSTCPIHLLGTGNPISILIYTISGANSYDGLEWCQMIIDYNNGLPIHMKFFDLFQYQSDWMSVPELPRSLASLFHNIDFYMSWMTRLNTAIENEQVMDLLSDYLPIIWDNKGKPIAMFDLVKNELPELFSEE